jgi:hypothetical protein
MAPPGNRNAPVGREVRISNLPGGARRPHWWRARIRSLLPRGAGGRDLRRALDAPPDQGAAGRARALQPAPPRIASRPACSGNACGTWSGWGSWSVGPTPRAAVALPSDRGRSGPGRGGDRPRHPGPALAGAGAPPPGRRGPGLGHLHPSGAVPAAGTAGGGQAQLPCPAAELLAAAQPRAARGLLHQPGLAEDLEVSADLETMTRAFLGRSGSRTPSPVAWSGSGATPPWPAPSRPGRGRAGSRSTPGRRPTTRAGGAISRGRRRRDEGARLSRDEGLVRRPGRGRAVSSPPRDG